MCIVNKFGLVITIGLLLINSSNGVQNKNLLSEEDKRGATNEIDSKSKRDLPVGAGSSKRYYGDYDSNRYGGSGAGYPHTSGLGNYGDDRRPSTYYEDDYHHSGGGYIGGRPSSYGSGYGSGYRPPPPGPIYQGGYDEDRYYPDQGGGEVGGIMGNYKSLTLKKILLPLAGLAILGVAAAASHNPILLPLGTLNGRRKRSLLPPDIYPINPHVRPYTK